MSQFTYTLPSGAEFVVNGPPGATRSQADRIFYEQVAAGALVGYSSGQTLTSPATKITKFELSRLERGTAGVDNPTMLAIINGLPVVASIPSLDLVPLTDPINQADIVTIKDDDLGPLPVGPLSSYQVQKILAQIANLVGQDYYEISQDKGIGRYGFTCYALEQAGYVKPGTSLRFFAVDPEDFEAVMSSPSVWTGNGGILSLNDFLSSPETQNFAQSLLMRQAYVSLQSAGAINQVPTPSIKLSSGQVYTNSGLQAISALTLLGAGNIGSLNGVVKNAISGSTVLNKLLSGGVPSLSTIGSGAVNNLTAGLKNLGSLANLNFANINTGVINQITGSVGGLLTNASKFGTQATALWAKSGGITGLASLTGTALNNIPGTLNGSINTLTKNLTNLVPGNLSNLTSNLDVFGKAGSFATNFANPLGNLNSLGNLQNLGNLSSLQNLGSLNNLSGQLGNLGNLGNLVNIGSVGSLFGGGGDLVSGTTVAGGFNNTVNRQTLDAAFGRILGSSKIPQPVFSYPGPVSIANRLDLLQAQNVLKDFQNPGSRTFGQGVTI